MNNYSVPVLLIVFNRPEKVRRLVENLRILKPGELYITADGPRENVNSDFLNCELVKREIDKIDWHCTVHKNYSNVNMGCKKGVVSGIDWFFSKVEYGIILEDDILPNISFFKFCEELLLLYRADKTIGMITGCNPVANLIDFGDYSYGFSTYANIWGWATWRRAWKNNDVFLKEWPIWKKKSSSFNALNKSFLFRLYWSDILDSVYRGKIDTWDFQWFFSMWLKNQFCIVPKYNLIENIGFDQSATHTDGLIPKYLLNNKPKEILGNLVHQTEIKRNFYYDNAITKVVFKISFITILKNKLHRAKYLGEFLVKIRRIIQCYTSK